MRGQLRKINGLLNRRIRRGLVQAAILILAGSTLEALGIGLLFPVIKGVADPGFLDRLPGGGIVRELDINRVMPVVILGFMALFVVKNAFLAYVNHWQNMFLAVVEAEYTQGMFGRYLGLPYEAQGERNSSYVITMLDETVSRVFRTAILAYLTITTEVLVLIGIVVVLFLADPLLTVGIAVFVLGAAVLVHLWLRGRIGVWGELSLQQRQKLLQIQQQCLASLPEIKAYGKEGYFVDLFGRWRREFAQTVAYRATFGQLPRFVVETVLVVAALFGLLILFWVGRDLADITATMGILAASAIRLLPSGNRILLAMQQLRFSGFAIDELAAEEKRFERQGTRNPVVHAAAVHRVRDFNTITLDSVSFAFAGAERAAVNDISLAIRRGESIGVVGASGAGKSTLAAILLGLLRPTGGRILVDGSECDIGVDENALHVGYVPQAVVLLDDSLRRNVAFGEPDGEIDDDRVREALRFALLEQVVARLPEGLDSRVGEFGARLSGGERQRIAIARALYRDPDLIVLDEATSALDVESEGHLARAVDGLRGVKTLFIIAHRLSTVRHCDRLLYLGEGRILDSGPFDDLRIRNAGFRRLVELAQVDKGAGHQPAAASDDSMTRKTAPEQV